jgi:A/G-specific adenine glycosylase
VLVPGRDASRGKQRLRPTVVAAGAAHRDLDPFATFDAEAGAAADRAVFRVCKHGPILARYTPGVPEKLAEPLLRWFSRGRRELPWRTGFPRDPYAVLVSEVMLQQTQVDRVAEAFPSFLRRFPSLEALAAAPEEDAVHAFSGLGYYRRARLLHASARAIVARGGWPRSAAELTVLPGFGPYTSAAVAAFAFAGGDPPVDGNVSRVTARLRALDLPMGSSALLAAGRELAAELHAETPTPEVWEALMELGATVCTPAAPRCGVCPLAGSCAALAAGTPLAYPGPRPARSRERQRWVAVWLQRQDGRVLLRRVDDGPLLAGLWLPPYAVLSEGTDPTSAARALAGEAGFAGTLSPAPAVRHGITHRDIRVLPYVATIPGNPVAEAMPGWSWQHPTAPALPTSSLLGKLAAACREVGARGVADQEG